MPPFMFATGIENSYPTIAGPGGSTIRVDEMEKTHHYRRWRDDFAMVKDLGIGYLRYGPPLFSTHTGPGRFDWSFADETFGALKAAGITPIVDLCHFGVPDWVGNFQNPDWPPLFAEYAQAFARRFPWVRHYTPVNEIFVAATFSGQYGWWNERLSSDLAFVTALKHLCKANVLAMRSILEGPSLTRSSSRASRRSISTPKTRPVKTTAHFLNEKRFLSLDLTYGHPIDVRMYEYLTDHGMSRAEYHWFVENHVRARCIMGNDYYITNEHLVHDDGTWSPSGEIFGYYVITHQYYARYRLPVMHTETNLQDAEKAPGLAPQGMGEHAPSQTGRRPDRRLHLVQPDRSG